MALAREGTRLDRPPHLSVPVQSMPSPHAPLRLPPVPHYAAAAVVMMMREMTMQKMVMVARKFYPNDQKKA